MSDIGPFTPDQQDILRLLGRMVAVVFGDALEIRLNIAAMQELLEQRYVWTEDEWETAVARVEERLRTDATLESLENREFDQLLAEFNRRLGKQDPADNDSTQS
jgi:hypothetical protein